MSEQDSQRGGGRPGRPTPGATVRPGCVERAGPRRPAADRVVVVDADRRSRRTVPGVPDRSWSQVSVSARECIGVSRCPFGTDCFAESARDRAGAADVVVTNHALLAIDAIGAANVLPEHDLLVVDEAHELVDRVTGVATAELSATSLGVAAAARRPDRGTGARRAVRSRGHDVHLGDLRRPAGPHRRARRGTGHLPERAAGRGQRCPHLGRDRPQRPDDGVGARRSRHRAG